MEFVLSVCLFLEENHLSCDQQHHCEVILVTAEMKSIHLLVGLVQMEWQSMPSSSRILAFLGKGI